VLVTRVMAKLEPGGAQLGALRLTVALRRLGIDSRWLAGTASPGGLALAREHAVDVEPYAASGDLQWTPSEDFAAWLAPRLTGAELVHAHMFGAWWAAARAIEAGVPLAASEHNAFRRPGPPPAAAAALPRVDRFFAHSPAAEAQIRALGFPPQRIERGQSPFAGASSRPLRGLPWPRIVFAGRLEPDKGPDVLIEALGLMRRALAPYLLGAGTLRASLAARAAELRLAVALPGWVAEPGRWMAGASAVVLPSREDAWPQTALLAMALGTPVVGAAVDGLSELLGEGRGILVPPEDPPALAAALAAVLAGRRRTDLAAARALAARYTPARVARHYADRYRELAALGDRSRAGSDPLTSRAGALRTSNWV
jgi:glycosyltransferase involved in cell wall biosynthesis